MTQDYPKAEELLDEQHNLWRKVKDVLQFPLRYYCKWQGHPKWAMKFTRMVKADGSDPISWRSCNFCGLLYEQDLLTILAIMERDLDQLEKELQDE